MIYRREICFEINKILPPWYHDCIASSLDLHEGTRWHFPACLPACTLCQRKISLLGASMLVLSLSRRGDVTVSEEKEECAKGSCASFVVKSLLPFLLLLLLVVLG